MKQQLIILASLLVFLAASCQNDDTDVFVETASSEDGVPVNVSFSMLKGLLVDNELVPMRSGVEMRDGEDVIKTNISNSVKVILAKKINSQWVLADYYDYKIDPSEKWVPIYHHVRDTTVFKPIEMILTPGDYSITLITGVNALTWNKNLKKGAILAEGENADWVCTYRLTDNGYLNPGLPALQEEIFAARKEFEVKKTDDLHSNPYVNQVDLTLQRKVGRLRFMLKKRTSSDPGVNVDMGMPGRSGFSIDNAQDFFIGYNNGITAILRLTDAGKKFSGGLNVWGDQQYNHYPSNNSNYATLLYFGVFTWDFFQTGNDGQDYMLGMRNGTRQFGCNYFTNEGDDLPIAVSEVRITAFSGGPSYEFDGIAEVSIKHNTITGLIFESGNYTWDYRMGQSQEYQRELLLVEDSGGNPVKSEDKFDNYYELRLHP